MKRIARILALSAVLLAALAPVCPSQESTGAAPTPGFSISGTVAFPKKGDIYIRVVTRELFEKDRTGEIRQILRPGPEEEKKGAMDFSFADVPPGTYAIQAFQDTRKNGVLDSGAFGPKEPWGTYRPARPTFRAPRWDEMAFPLEGDVTGIRITLK